MPSRPRLTSRLSDRGDLIARLAAALVVDDGRRSGDPETRVSMDHRLPDPGSDDPSPRARWRLATSGARLYPPPVARESISVWHGADGAKGRRLLAGDLANDNRVAAVLAWHFEPDASGRPHLVTAAAVRDGVERVGLVRDSAIGVDLDTLKLLGFRRGKKADGYDGDYYVFEA